VQAIAGAGDTLPDEDRARLLRPRTPVAVAKARRERESRLMAWRRATAAERNVDEQVVLPGHCLKDAAEAEPTSIDDLSRVPGVGQFRVLRDGDAIVRVLRGDAPS
jgi:ribonuclease D